MYDDTRFEAFVRSLFHAEPRFILKVFVRVLILCVVLGFSVGVYAHLYNKRVSAEMDLKAVSDSYKVFIADCRNIEE